MNSGHRSTHAAVQKVPHTLRIVTASSIQDSGRFAR